MECPFEEAGCRMYKLRHHQLDDHLSSNQQQHLLLVMGAYKQVKELTTAVQLLRQGKEADKETVDSIIICSTNLEKAGDKVTVTMPRVSEYHCSGKIWRSAPFYFKDGYKMCLAVGIKNMESSECVGISISIYLLKGECDDQLKWPIGNNQCQQLPPHGISGMLYMKYVHFYMCPFQHCQPKKEQLLNNPHGTYFHNYSE